MELDGRAVMITGASRGLGRALALELAGRGARLVLTARGGADLEAVARRLEPVTAVEALAGDVADVGHAQRLVAAGAQRFGRIDVLINNASVLGASPMPRIAAYPPEALDEVFRVNVRAPLHLAGLVIPGMLLFGEGVILNVTSYAGVQAYPGWGGYGASKAALEHASRVLAAELDGTGVRVYVVDPGDMNTQMHRDAEPGVDLSHLPDPERVAPAIVQFLEQGTAPFGRFEAQALLPATR